MKTTIVPVSAQSKWFTIDATGLTIGQVSTNAAHVLRGKHKAAFSGHQLCGDHVIVLNADKLSISARKLLNKMYFDHTGYLGHWRNTPLGEMMKKDPRKPVEIAVKGMLAKNRLSLQMMKRLHVMVGAEHKYAAQKPEPLTFTI